MKIYCEPTLTSSRKEALTELVKRCQEDEPITLSLPEDGCWYLTACEGEQNPKACLILCPAGNNLREVYAFTHPNYRRKGLFSMLYQQALGLIRQEEQTIGENIHLLFLSDEKSPQAQAAYHAMGFRLISSEYVMELHSSSSHRPSLSPDLSRRKPLWKNLSLTREEFEDEEEKSLLFQAYLPAFSCPGKKSGIHRCSSLVKAGSCRLLPYGPHRFYLYHVLSPQDLRGLGLGTALLSALLDTLPENSVLFLQVSSENPAALHLYKKTGFRICRTLSYYS